MTYWWKKVWGQGDVRPNRFICTSGCISSQTKTLRIRLKKHTRHSVVPSDVQVCHHQSYIHQGLSTLSMGWDDSQLDTHTHTPASSADLQTLLEHRAEYSCGILQQQHTARWRIIHNTTICQNCMNEPHQKIQRTSQENIATFKGYIYIVGI